MTVDIISFPLLGSPLLELNIFIKVSGLALQIRDIYNPFLSSVYNTVENPIILREKIFKSKKSHCSNDSSINVLPTSSLHNSEQFCFFKIYFLAS